MECTKLKVAKWLGGIGIISMLLMTMGLVMNEMGLDIARDVFVGIGTTTGITSLITTASIADNRMGCSSMYDFIESGSAFFLAALIGFIMMGFSGGLTSVYATGLSLGVLGAGIFGYGMLSDYKHFKIRGPGDHFQEGDGFLSTCKTLFNTVRHCYKDRKDGMQGKIKSKLNGLERHHKLHGNDKRALTVNVVNKAQQFVFGKDDYSDREDVQRINEIRAGTKVTRPIGWKSASASESAEKREFIVGRGFLNVRRLSGIFDIQNISTGAFGLLVLVLIFLLSHHFLVVNQLRTQVEQLQRAQGNVSSGHGTVRNTIAFERRRTTFIKKKRPTFLKMPTTFSQRRATTALTTRRA